MAPTENVAVHQRETRVEVLKQVMTLSTAVIAFGLTLDEPDPTTFAAMARTFHTFPLLVSILVGLIAIFASGYRPSEGKRIFTWTFFASGITFLIGVIAFSFSM